MNSNHPGKKLGLWTATSLVVGNMIGSGVFLMPAALAGYGSVSLLGWVFAAVGSFFLAKVFGNLSKLAPGITGGPYAYTREGLGDFTGFLVAWGYYICVACANAAITISFVSALSTFFPVLNNNPVPAVLAGLAAIWLLTWINTRGIAVSGKLQLVTTLLKILPLIIVAFGGLFFIRPENFIPFNRTGGSVFSAINITATFTMFAFVGIESASVPAGNVEKPEITIPRATLIGLMVATVIYLLGSISIMGMLPAETLQKSTTPYADAAEIMFGKSARYWVSAGVAIAAFGALNGWILLQGQLPRAIAKDKLFPILFAKENRKGVPYTGIVINSILISLFMIMNYTKGLVEQFRFLLTLSVFLVLVPYLLSTVAYLILRLQSKGANQQSLSAPVMLFILAFGYSLWAIAGAGEKTVYAGFLLLMVGAPFYVWVKKSNEKNNT
ncbi:amino acid permease [Mucilaginibacter sp. RS28]|uniref:Arginine/agmatine antiporter n=1 Tax=Mucilaginibacter straminoryzae TaxID=2932774 RepID=A0A9X2B980_9SPHI|nr:amino acid permease [Mucilaginibacter straminoryzae]MCJ8210196.1 amino acid permease [Mucilaginibacter straminoryzae]